MMVLGQYGAVLVVFFVVLGQYNLVLFGIKWHWLSMGLKCLYISKKWRFGWVLPKRDNNEQTKKDRATQPLDHGLVLGFYAGIYKKIGDLV